MKLARMVVRGFTSIREQVTLDIDSKITTLIGANDTGKTNLLRAIQCLNSSASFAAGDRNWDLPKESEPEIEWLFDLSAEDRKKVSELLQEALKDQAKDTTVKDSPADELIEISELKPPVPDASGRVIDVTILKFPNRIKLRRVVGEDVQLVSPNLEDLCAENPAVATKFRQSLYKMLPRVQLFMPAEQRMDIVTLAELEQPTQEFMQGIFRYADIWEQRKDLFQQTTETEYQLVQASDRFTERIRREWQQGEDLTFRLSHAGTNGDHIQLLIQDPSVRGRFVKPSQRSEGFSAFFTMSMRLLARTEASDASSHIFLFDEPGTALHPAGQVNLLRVFERLSDDNQIVYSTHSLFMINHNRPYRNRVISKGTKGTAIDQKPFLKNWRAVRDSLGLILAGTFFIADRTLLVEGESDAMYVGALLGAYDRAGVLDVDLNLFSVLWAGNERDFAPMARLLLEEGREVIALVDGDDGGKKMKERIEKLNADIAKTASSLKPVSVIELPKDQSIEDVLPDKQELFKAVAQAAEELIKMNFRERANGGPADEKAMLAPLSVDKGNRTMGRHLEDVVKPWFKDPEPVSKLMIARNVIAWLEQADLKKSGVAEVPDPLKRIVEKLRLASKESDKAVFEKPKAN